MTSLINDVFERVVVLNLDRRPDRMANVGAQLDRLGIGYERFAAVDGRAAPVRAAWQAYAERSLVEPPDGGRPVTSYREFYLDYDSHEARVAFVEQRTGRKAIATPGAFGLLLSMTGIVERALGAGWASVLILEDDVLFHRETCPLFARCLAQAPADWAVLQLGAMQLHWEADWITWASRNLYRCNGSSIGAHAVGLRRETFEPLLERCRQRDLPYDIGALHDVKRRFRARCLTVFPNLVIQDASDSEIGMSTLFFREARKSDNLYRWHLPDYGLAAPGGAAGGSPPPLPDAEARTSGTTIRTVSGRRSSTGAAGSLRAGIGSALRRLLRPAGRQGSARPPEEGGTAALGAPAPVGPAAEARSGLQPLRARTDERPGARCVLAVVVGLPRDDLATVVARLCRASGTVPVFLTDDDRFEVFRSHRAAFEYLAPAEPRPGLDWDLYRLRRLALLRRKWQPAKIVAFGAPAVGLVDAWRRSPFEDQGILALTGSPAPGVDLLHR